MFEEEPEVEAKESLEGEGKSVRKMLLQFNKRVSE